MCRVVIGVAKCHKREAIRTHRKERAGFFQNSHVCRIEVWKLVVELCCIGEIHGREDILEAGTGLKQYHWVSPTGSFHHVQDGDSGIRLGDGSLMKSNDPHGL